MALKYNTENDNAADQHIKILWLFHNFTLIF